MAEQGFKEISSGIETFHLVADFKACLAEGGGPRNVAHHCALVVQIIDAEYQTRTGLLGHSQINYPQLSPAGLLHEASSRSYIAKISAEA